MICVLNDGCRPLGRAAAARAESEGRTQESRHREADGDVAQLHQ
jgi:hypothetical protein